MPENRERAWVVTGIYHEIGLPGQPGGLSGSIFSTPTMLVWQNV